MNWQKSYWQFWTLIIPTKLRISRNFLVALGDQKNRNSESVSRYNAVIGVQKVRELVGGALTKLSPNSIICGCTKFLFPHKAEKCYQAGILTFVERGCLPYRITGKSSRYYLYAFNWCQIGPQLKVETVYLEREKKKQGKKENWPASNLQNLCLYRHQNHIQRESASHGGTIEFF